MTTLLSLLYNVPILFGVLAALIMILVMASPWRLLWECVLLAAAAIVILISYWLSEALRKFKKWMRKPASWEDDLPDLWI